MILAAAGAAALIYTHKSSSPLSKYAYQVSFPVYGPAKLSAGYTLNPKSINVSGDLLVYSLAGTSKKPTLVVTQQSTPADFDANKLVGKNASALAVPTGTLYDISAGEQSKYMLTTGTTLIFISSDSKVENGVVNSLASDLHKVE